MYTLYQIEFKTKAEITAYCRDLLARTPEGSDLSGDDLAIMRAIFAHRKGGEKITKEVVAIYVKINFYGVAKAFYLRFADGTEDDISYVKSIKDIPEDGAKYSPSDEMLANFKKALRWEIKSQILAYRNSEFGKNPDQFCAITGERLEWGSVHVDHFPDAFDDLIWNFCLERKIYIADVVLVDLGEYKEISDAGIKAAWRAYHLKHAKLRLTTPKANTSATKPSSKPWHSIINPETIKKAS